MNTKRRISLAHAAGTALVVLLAGGGFSGSWAQEVESSGQSGVAVIDVRRILTESEAGRGALEMVRELADVKSTEIKVLQEGIDALEADIAAKQLSLTAEKIREMEADLQDKSIEIRRAQDDARRELEELQVEQFTKIEQRVMPLISEIGSREGFTLIFNKFEDSGLLYAAAGADITDRVLKLFNELPEE